MKRRITAKQKYTTYANYPLVSGDVRAYELCLDLGKEVEGAVFKVTAIRADGKVIEDIGSVKNGLALYTMASNMYSVPGELTVRLAVVHDTSVLTDREIIFNVLEGITDVDQAESVVPINDSVILRLATVEQTISAKVDKIAGKTLSSNDFTDGYKEKLDLMDETIGAEVERISEDVDNLSDELEKKMQKGDAYLKSEVYTKGEVSALLTGKLDRSEVSNIYKFKGSVNTFEDLPAVENVSAGDVYNVLDSDMNYAWSGQNWDSLGGEHRDMEARAQIGKVDEALNVIIAIQNSLLGGSNV